ncbi:HTH-type transcriptional regulator Xre [invertebrate metagenome]|uniref:HTH-type transcriptional regulator Xre n=1 Tax=invertebrate metagenome TaxID=1711999 RepID=A0A2H9T3P0_9ZZZZ
MNLSTRILQARKNKKLSQQSLADMIGISRSALAQWETEMSSPSVDNLRKMAELVNVSFEWLATGRGNQYLSMPIDTICDTQVDQEIMRSISTLELKKKRAILSVIQTMK